jgi:hypothetical protein
MMKSSFYWLPLVCASALSSSSFVRAQSAEVNDVLDVQRGYQTAAQQSQQRVEELDQQTLAMVARYNDELERHDDLLAYNENLRQLLASQAEEKTRLAAELGDIEVVRQSIVPLMLEMVQVLERFIQLDKPLLLEERQARLEKLQANLTRSDVDLAEKYRRLLDAYQIEAEYGQSLEAYEGTASVDGRERRVDFLRVGRLALYFVALDRSEAGIWNPAAGSWNILPASALDGLDYALRVARKQAPPNLLELPLWSEVSQ